VTSPNDPACNKYLQQLQAHRTQLQCLGVRRLGLFGSCLRGDEGADSDIDLLVEFEPGQKSLANLVDLGELLEALFGRRVDLVTLESLSPYIGPHILREVQYAEVAA
jgi:predicted nucleotidyltransferase